MLYCMAMKLAHSSVTSDYNMATDKEHKQLAHVPLISWENMKFQSKEVSHTKDIPR